MSARAALTTIRAERVLTSSPEAVYGFLAHLANHWRLTDRYVRLKELSPDGAGARVVVAAPLGFRRTARTAVTTARRPERFGGTAVVGRRTRAYVLWRIEPHDHGAHVALEATVLEASRLDRVLLALGGRWWLGRSFERALQRLAVALAPGAVPATAVRETAPAPALADAVL